MGLAKAGKAFDPDREDAAWVPFVRKVIKHDLLAHLNQTAKGDDWNATHLPEDYDSASPEPKWTDEYTEALEVATENLDKGDAKLIRLVYHSGLTREQIAKKLKMKNAAAVTYKLNLILKSMKEELL